jgi:hypothetical protein
VDEPAPVVREHDEHEQQSERGRGHDEEISRYNLTHVIGEEGPPRLGRRVWMSLHVFGHGGFTHHDSQLLKFPVNPRRAPERVRRRHLSNQRAEIVRYRQAAGAMSAHPRPEQTKPAPVPRDGGFRFDDVNGRTPAVPAARKPRPQHPIDGRQAETRAPRSIHDGELVSERDDFQV